MNVQRSTWDDAPLREDNRIEYVPIIRNNPKATEAEKESTRLWNLMVDTLRKNGLMKEKGEE